MNEADKVSEMKRLYETHSSAMLSVWTDMRECFDYVGANQYTSTQRTYLEDLGRIVRAYNIVQSQIVVIDGYMTKNPLRIRAIPREPGDTKKADIITEVMAQSYDECNFAYEIQRATTDAVICGHGFIWNGWIKPTERYLDGQYFGKRMSPFDIIYDISDQSKRISEGAWIMETRWYPYDQIISEMCEGNEALIQALDEAAARYESPEQTSRRRKSALSNQMSYGNLQFNVTLNGTKGNMNVDRAAHQSSYLLPERGLARVIRMSERRYSDIEVVIDPLTMDEHKIPQEISPEERMMAIQMALMATNQQGNERAVQKKTVPEYWEVSAVPGLLEYSLIKENPADVQDEGHAIKEIRCYDYDPDKDKHRGIVHHIRDAQDAVNRRRSMQDDLIAKILYPDYQIEEGIIESKWVSWWKSRKIGRLLPRPKNTKKADREDPPQFAGTLIDQDFQIDLKLAQQITGITPYIQGNREGSMDNATLYRDLVEQSEIGISPILSNYKKSFEECGRYKLKLLQRFMTYPRWIRTVNRGGEVEFKYRINTVENGQIPIDVTTGKYDIIIDAQPTGRFERERKALQVRDAMQYADDLNKQALLPHYYDYMDLPESDKLVSKAETNFLLQNAPELFVGIDPFTKARLMLGDIPIRQVIDEQEAKMRMMQMSPQRSQEITSGIERQDHSAAPLTEGIPA